MGTPAFFGPMGVVSSLGMDMDETISALMDAARKLGPVTHFPVPSNAVLPTGEIASIARDDCLPRTHQLARIAADRIFSQSPGAPDAIVVGTTTGGIDRTEELLLKGEKDPLFYRLHGADSVAADLAERYGCIGPVLTVSAACASGALAIALAAAMIRKGIAKRVLAGGADGLCRLTYFGFKSLQLIDPLGARPLDCERRGISVAEGAGFALLLKEPLTETPTALLGYGLSCDAYHATAPHPQGLGALTAMQDALQDAGLSPSQIDYISLHGTATPDNDRSEALAVNSLCGPDLPLHSSIKGAMGHSLAAAGAIEAIVAALCVAKGIVPANVGLANLDPQLHLDPVIKPLRRKISAVLSNSFGFGGSNAALAIGRARKSAQSITENVSQAPFSVLAYSCVTGAGFLEKTAQTLSAGRNAAGCLDEQSLCKRLEPALVRRAKRLPRLALALAAELCSPDAGTLRPDQIVLGTGWGALSETHDFLIRLFESDCQFPSPADFIGSVHNAPAGRIAEWLGINGANVSVSGGDYAFDQALLSADLFSTDKEETFLVLGADEAHPVLSPLFDPSEDREAGLCDGGGALLLSKKTGGIGVVIDPAFYGRCRGENDSGAISRRLIARLEEDGDIRQQFGLLMVGMPSRQKTLARAQLRSFLAESGFEGPTLDYRAQVGCFAGAGAVATVLSVHWVKEKRVPGNLLGTDDIFLDAKGILLLNLGENVTAARVLPR